MWDTTKAVLRRKFIALNAFVRKEERSKINHLSFHLRTIEREEQIESKVHRRKEIMKIRAELNENENMKLIKSTKPKSGTLRRIKSVSL